MRHLHARVKGLSALVALLALAVASAASTETASQPAQKSAAAASVPHTTKSARKNKKSRKIASRKRGQQKIDSERTRQIQEALIREHYLSGSASGAWDAATQQAMQKYQADNGWQSKTTPDSRALIRLGLGPDQQHLLNPESAMTSNSQTAHRATDPAKTTDPSPETRPQN